MTKKEPKAQDWEEYINETQTIEDSGWVRGFAKMMRRLPKRLGTILEVGCSGGRWIQWYKKRHTVTNAHGIDIYDITKIHGKGTSKKEQHAFIFKKGDARTLPYKNNAFDFVYSLGLVEHFKDKADVKKIIQEQARVLKQGGYIVTTFPTLNIDSLGYWRMKLIEDKKHDYKHYNTTIPQLRTLYEKNNLEVLDAQYLGWFFEPHGIPKFTTARQFSQIACIIGRKKYKKTSKKNANKKKTITGKS